MKRTKKIEPATSADFSIPAELLKTPDQTQIEEENARILRQQLKAITEKIDTKKKERHRIAAKKSREKKLALLAASKAAQIAIDTPSPVAVAAPKSKKPVVPPTMESNECHYITVMTVNLDDNRLLKVVFKDEQYHVVEQMENILGVFLDVKSSHPERYLAVNALAAIITSWAQL